MYLPLLPHGVISGHDGSGLGGAAVSVCSLGVHRNSILLGGSLATPLSSWTGLRGGGDTWVRHFCNQLGMSSGVNLHHNEKEKSVLITKGFIFQGALNDQVTWYTHLSFLSFWWCLFLLGFRGWSFGLGNLLGLHDHRV